MVKFKEGDKVIYTKKDPFAISENNLDIGTIMTVYQTSTGLTKRKPIVFCRLNDNSTRAFFEDQVTPLNDITRLLYPETKE